MEAMNRLMLAAALGLALTFTGATVASADHDCIKVKMKATVVQQVGDSGDGQVLKTSGSSANSLLLEGRPNSFCLYTDPINDALRFDLVECSTNVDGRADTFVRRIWQDDQNGASIGTGKDEKQSWEHRTTAHEFDTTLGAEPVDSNLGVVVKAKEDQSLAEGDNKSVKVEVNGALDNSPDTLITAKMAGKNKDLATSNDVCDDDN